MGKLPFEKDERKILVKKEESTNSAYGKRPEERTVEELLQSSVICLNKPEGPTSHQVADFVKRVLNVEKCGHGGTLDPKVTGVLPIAIGRATRVLELLLKGGKEYVCIMHLHKPVDQKIIEKELKTFVGKITQLPPVRSAVKRQKRQREIYYLDILDINGQDILFTMGCQGGTYVRKFVHDFGKHLKIGAHMAELVRAKAGPFTDKDWCSLHDLQDAFFLYREKKDDSLLRKCLRPVEFAASHLGKVYVSDSAVDSLCHGASLNLPGVVKVTTGINVDQLVGIYTLKEELIGMGVARLMSEKMISEEKGLAVAPRKIFMDPGIYPKYQKAKPL